MSNLPASIFQSALREVEERKPFLARVASATALREVAGAAEEDFLKAMREECARRGWVQADVADPNSWEFHEVAGFDSTSSGPVHRPTNNNPGGFETDAVERNPYKPSE